MKNLPNYNSITGLIIRLFIFNLLFLYCLYGSAQEPFNTHSTPCTNENVITTINTNICEGFQSIHVDNEWYCRTSTMGFRWIVYNKSTGLLDTLGKNNTDFEMSMDVGDYQFTRLMYTVDYIHDIWTFVNTSNVIDVRVVDCFNVCIDTTFVTVIDTTIFVDTVMVHEYETHYDTIDIVSYDTVTVEDTVTTFIDEYCIEHITLQAEDKDLCKLSIFPNPAQECIFFELEYLLPVTSTIQVIYDTNGGVYHHGAFMNTICLDSGVYYISLIVEYKGEEYTYSEQFIIL